MRVVLITVILTAALAISPRALCCTRDPQPTAASSNPPSPGPESTDAEFQQWFLAVAADGSADTARDQLKRPPVVAAIVRGDLVSLKLLLEKGASANPRYRDSPLHAAVASKRPELVELLLKHDANLLVCNSGGSSVFSVAANTGDDAVFKLLLDAAKSRKCLETVLPGPSRMRLIDQALCDAARKNRSSWIDLLIDAGANVNARGSLVKSPLVEACATGSIESARVLIIRGARVDTDEDPPLESAALAPQNGPELIRLLLASGAKMRDGLVRTAVSYNRDDTLRCLLELDAPVEAKDNVLKTAIWSGKPELVRAALEAKRKNGTRALIPTEEDVISARQAVEANRSTEADDILQLILLASKAS